MPLDMETPASRWPAEHAWEWYRNQHWVCGFNYLPRTAVNSTAMWQEPTFDPPTIEEELTWARAAGFNACRVFVQYLVWEQDAPGLRQRMKRFLEFAGARAIATVFCLFDDCAFSGKQPYPGPQEEPVPGVHNSQWTPSPGHERVVDPGAWPKLEAYVRDLTGYFGRDRRVLFWDLYNEPGNGGMGAKSAPLLKGAFSWARHVDPKQPLTAGSWTNLPAINRVLAENGDILTFHSYEDLNATRARVERLEKLGRPVICTEWMSRVLGSRVATHLPFFKSRGVGCFLWGLVKGRTQTHLPWDHKPGAPEPKRWHHDLFHPDGTPYDPAEIEHIRRATRR